MKKLKPWLTDLERSKDLAKRAYIIPLTFGRARIVIDLEPNAFYNASMVPMCPATMCPLFAKDGSPWTGERNAPCPGHDNLDDGGCPWWGMGCAEGGPAEQIAAADVGGTVLVVGPNKPKRASHGAPRAYDCPRAAQCQWQIRASLRGRLCPPRVALARGLDPRLAAF